MKLSQLFSIYSQYRMGQDPTLDVHGLASDHRKVQPGWVFVAVKGTRFDGHSVLKDAVEAGAIGLVVQDMNSVPAGYDGAVVCKADTAKALGQLAHHYFGNPTKDMFCVGVTGTNGKTSSCYMIEKVFNDFGWSTGVLGTVDHHLGQCVWSSDLTTPDPLVLAERLSQMKAAGAKAIAMEVSSHALAQRRVYGIEFDGAGFTNLSQDHLDYHTSLQEYFSEKEKLFSYHLGRSSKPSKIAVINRDDAWGQQISINGTCRRLDFGQGAEGLHINIIRMDFSGTRFVVRTASEEQEGFLPVPGDFFVQNACLAIGFGLHVGISLTSILKSLESFNGVPGRMQRVPVKKDVHVFVDYAHTDDALRSVLRAFNHIKKYSQEGKRIHCVFGCGGDRDRAKRPLMLMAAIEGADRVYLTSDNPRSEEPMDIINDCISGVPSALVEAKVVVDVDRASAIRQALIAALPGDVILVAGKGHENYQILKDKTVTFSDSGTIKEMGL